MVDNITGFGSGADEISLGLNLNSNVGNSISDFNTLDQILQQMIKDEQTFNGIQSDTLEKAKATTQEIKSSGVEAQQLISIFKALRGEQQGTLQDAKQLTATYQQFNNELQKVNQNKSRMGVTGATSVPGSSPGAQPIVTSSPATQTGGSGGRGPTVPGQPAGFAEEPDDFFGKEEAKSGGRSSGRRPSDIDMGGIDALDLNTMDLENAQMFGGGGSGPGRARVGTSNEKYKQLSDLAWSIFPNQGYYRNMRRVRWLTRNEGGSINKFVNSGAGQKLGYALNRLGGGQRLRTNEGYQLFPFAQDEDGNYIGTNNQVVGGQYEETPSTLYGLQNAKGQWLSQGGPGTEQPTWSWSGEGEMPPMPNETPQSFNPWERPNLTATGEGAAKIAGSAYALRVAKAKGGDLFREGQLYTGITGGTGVEGALKYDLGAQLTSWFGLNPLESYGQAKQITMQNLALGYRGNLLNQANSFGNQALQKYGVDPQTSMQMFGQMVMQAGASLQDLDASLSTLAHTASTTNTSFSQLQQNVIQYSQIGGSIGLTGSENATFATAAAQYAAGQPSLGATGANPADILDSMVGQALVAQQMGTSFLGLPAAASSQGARGVLKGEIAVNESLMNRIGLTQGNYQNTKSLQGSYQKFKLLMSTLPGMKKEADMQYPQYVKYIHDMFSGKQTKELNKTLTSKFAQDIGGKAGEGVSDAIAGAIHPSTSDGTSAKGSTTSSSNAISREMQEIETQNKWKNIGVDVNGQFRSLNDIDKMPTGMREALEAKIATGAVSLSHVNQHGKLIKGAYSTGTLLDREGQSAEQFNEFGKTPNRGAMQRAERNAMKIELGPNAQKIFTLLDDPSAFNRYINRWAKTHGAPTTEYGNPRTKNH